MHSQPDYPLMTVKEAITQLLITESKVKFIIKTTKHYEMLLDSLRKNIAIKNIGFSKYILQLETTQIYLKIKQHGRSGNPNNKNAIMSLTKI